MKKTLFALLATLAFALAAPIAGTAQRFFDITKVDTLTNQDTIIVTTTTDRGPATMEQPYYYSYHILTDSLSGANAGTAYLQFSNDRLGTTWYNAQTLTIDGATQQSVLWEGICYARRARVYFITPSGTRSTRVQLYSFWKRID